MIPLLKISEGGSTSFTIRSPEIVFSWFGECALEVIPRTLVQNCGASVIRQMTALRAKHAKWGGAKEEKGTPCKWGIDGLTGEISDMEKLEVYDPLAVKLQVYKTAVETAVLLLRIDDIIQGTRKADGTEGV